MPPDGADQRPDVIVVGAGISGVSCARLLREAGARVIVLDRGRRPGGRLGLRHHDGRPVDTGASYFTVSDDEFRTVVEGWRARGLARPWTDTFTALHVTDAEDSTPGENSTDGQDGRRPRVEADTKSGPERWASADGLRGLVDDLAEGLDLRVSRTVDRVEPADGGWTVRTGEDVLKASVVVLAMPDPQARRLLPAAEQGPFDLEFEPVLALTAIWPTRTWPDRDGAFVNGDPVLSWIADDGLRRGDRAPVLVAHSTPDFARPRLADPAAATEPMAARLVQVFGLESAGEPELLQVQRWSFARPAAPRDQPFLLTEHGLGGCGDGWAAKPSVEAAFLSGRRLGAAILAGR